jgi:hypothetical protein
LQQHPLQMTLLLLLLLLGVPSWMPAACLCLNRGSNLTLRPSAVSLGQALLLLLLLLEQQPQASRIHLAMRWLLSMLLLWRARAWGCRSCNGCWMVRWGLAAAARQAPAKALVPMHQPQMPPLLLLLVVLFRIWPPWMLTAVAGMHVQLTRREWGHFSKSRGSVVLTRDGTLPLPLPLQLLLLLVGQRSVLTSSWQQCPS